LLLHPSFATMQACRHRVAATAAPYAAPLWIVVVYCAAFDHRSDV